RVEHDLISRIKEAQKEDSEIWTIVKNLDKLVEFHLDNDNVLWQDTRTKYPWLLLPGYHRLRGDMMPYGLLRII
nr:hypothetical protein [Tanacetum cinerariifolium]